MPTVRALTAKSLDFLASLDNICRNNDVNKRSDSFVSSQERRSSKSYITWVIEKSLLDKKKSYGDYIEGPSIKFSSPAIRKILLYPNGKKGYNEKLLCISVHFKDLPDDMQLEGDVCLLGKDGETMLSDTFSGNANDMKEIDLYIFVFELSRYIVNRQLTIRFRINSLSQISKCVSDKSTYQVQNHPEIITYKNMMLDIRKYSDVMLDIDNKMLECHKFILASESRALSILFKSCNRNILDMHDQPTAIMEELVHFIYSGNIQLFKFNHVCQLYIAADEFGVLNLKDVCSVFLSNCLSEKNVPYIFELSLKYKDQFLLERCIKFVKDNNIKSLRHTFMERSMKM